MGTRANIIVHLSSGKWERVYVHWDGYLEGVGYTLFDHYNSQERAEALVEPGDISSLDQHCDKPPGHSYDNRAAGRTVYYGRDRGEEDVAGSLHDTLDEAWGDPEEYVYVFNNGAWTYSPDPDAGPGSLVDLGKAVRIDRAGEGA